MMYGCGGLGFRICYCVCLSGQDWSLALNPLGSNLRETVLQTMRRHVSRIGYVPVNEELPYPLRRSVQIVSKFV